MARTKTYARIDAHQIKRETEKAWLVQDMTGDYAWLPKSVCKRGERGGLAGTVPTFSCPMWFAHKCGLRFEVIEE